MDLYVYGDFVSAQGPYIMIWHVLTLWPLGPMIPVDPCSPGVP